jgi:hypothetical protein
MKIGDIITFKYTRGSNPGKYRTVRITGLSNIEMEGITEPDGGFRRYLTQFMSDTCVVATAPSQQVAYIGSNALRIGKFRIALYPSSNTVSINGKIYNSDCGDDILEAIEDAI